MEFGVTLRGKWAEPQKELRLRHRGGHTTEEGAVESTAEEGWNDATQRPAKTTKSVQNRDTCPGRCWGIDVAGKWVRIYE